LYGLIGIVDSKTVNAFDPLQTVTGHVAGYCTYTMPILPLK